MVDRDPISKVHRRVVGYHDIRMDGMADLLLRARGMSVLDVGCNRGMVGFELAVNGARLVHGCDIYEKGIETAREVFADMRYVQSRFEVVDLTQGAKALAVFGAGQYDLVLLLAIIHKLIRVMTMGDLKLLLKYLGQRAGQYVAANTVSEHAEILDEVFAPLNLKRVQTSTISDFGLAVIWRKGG